MGNEINYFKMILFFFLMCKSFSFILIIYYTFLKMKEMFYDELNIN